MLIRRDFILAICAAAVVTIAPHFTNSAEAAFHGSASVPSGFNNGKFQLNMNFPQSGGDYPFLDFTKTSQTWDWNDNSGKPSPTDVNANGFPKSGTLTMTAHGGVRSVFAIPAEAYIGGNCPSGIIGTCFAYRTTGKGTFSNPGGQPITVSASSVVSTGSVVTVNFSATQDFRAGMEVPLSGTMTGLTASNGGGGPVINGGATGAWTACPTGLTTTSIQLCLNDGVTNLTTTTAGTATGTTTVQYGRNAVGVATKGRLVTAIKGSPLSLNYGISAQDNTTPITAHAFVLEGNEEALWEQGKIFRPKYLNTLLQGPGFPAYLRDLDSGQKNISTEVNWCDRSPVGYYSYASGTLDSGCGTIYAGTAASATTNDYAITFGSGAPVEHQKLILSFDATAVTSSSLGAGSPATLTFASAHNLHVGDPINLFDTFGGSNAPPTATTSFTGTITVGTQIVLAVSGITTGNGIVLGMTVSGAAGSPVIVAQLTGTPGGNGTYQLNSGTAIGPVAMTALVVLPIYNPAVQAIPYFVTTVVNSTAINYSAFPGGQPISTSTAGVGTLNAHKTIVVNTVTYTVNGTNVNWPNHNLSVGEPLGILCFNNGQNCNLAAPLIFSQNYYVKTVVDANNITIAASPNGTAITFTSAGTATQQMVRSPTLSLNGTRAIPIRDQYGKPIQHGENPLAFIYNNQVAYGNLVYDAVEDSWIKVGADANSTDVYMTSGWPPEIFLELCKEIGARPWIVAPPLTMDSLTGMTDYMPSVMALVKYQYPSWMLPAKFEINNEEWNFIFRATNYALGHALVYGTTGLPNYAGWALTKPENDYAGKTFSVLGQAANAVFGGPNDGSQYQVIVGVQTSNFTQPFGPSDGVARINSSAFVGQTATAPPSLTGPWGAGGTNLTINFAKDPGYKWGWEVACVQYFTSGYDGVSTLETTLASQFAAGQAAVTINNGTPNVAGTSLTVVSDSIGRMDSGSSQLYGEGVPYGTSVTGTYPNFTTSNPALLQNSGSANLLFVQSTSIASAIQTWVDSHNYDATFTGTITGNQLVTTGTTGFIIPNSSSVGGIALANGFGDVLAPAPGIPDLTYISSQISGTPNGDGTYQLSGTLSNQGPVTMHTSGLFGIPSLGTAYRAVARLANGTDQSGGGWGGGVYHLHMTGYEGGYSPGQNNSLLPFWQYGKYVTSTPNAAKGLETLVTQNCVNFKAAGGDYCSLFQFTGLPVQTAPWDALNDIYQQGPTPYWNGYLNLP